ncbi:hypothetical protein [Halalkalibacter flavus]|uniref:hypothetical protein n=1 Tax=Halalkalibacter flavus TaxID=3090668 RepID=UPI002FC94456
MAAGKEALTYSKLEDLSHKKREIFFGTSVGNIGEITFQESIINANLNNYKEIPITNSQALGIQLNDLIKKRCSKELFGHTVPYTSIKSMIGNPFGAAGIIQVISSLLSINYGIIPPTIKTTKRGI